MNDITTVLINKERKVIRIYSPSSDIMLFLETALLVFLQDERIVITFPSRRIIIAKIGDKQMADLSQENNIFLWTSVEIIDMYIYIRRIMFDV